MEDFRVRFYAIAYGLRKVVDMGSRELDGRACSPPEPGSKDPRGDIYVGEKNLIW